MSVQRIHAGVSLPIIPQELVRPTPMVEIQKWNDLNADERAKQAASFSNSWDPKDPSKITEHPWFPVLGNLSICDFNAFGEEDE